MDSFGYRINLVSEGDKTYFRFDNDYSIEIKEKIQKQYGKDLEVALTTSGMNAIYSSIVSIMSKWNWDSNTMEGLPGPISHRKSKLINLGGGNMPGYLQCVHPCKHPIQK